MADSKYFSTTKKGEWQRPRGAWPPPARRAAGGGCKAWAAARQPGACCVPVKKSR